MKQSFLRSLVQSKVLLAIEIVIVLSLVFAVGQEVFRRKSVQEEVSRLEDQIEQLEQKNIHLAETLKEMTSENFIEKEARKKLDLQKEGETVIFIPDANNEGEILVTRNTETSNSSDVQNPEQWWKYFFQTQS